MRLGHHEGRDYPALDDGEKPPFLLCRRPQRLDHHHVAVVGGGAVEDRRPEDRAIHRLVTHRHADLADTAASEFGRKLKAPQVLGPGLGAQRGEPVQVDVLVRNIGGRIGFERQHMTRDEILDPVAQRGNLGGDGETHGCPHKPETR